MAANIREEMAGATTTMTAMIISRASSFLAEKLGCAADHESCKEHGEDGVHEHTDEAHPDTAEYDLADGHIEHVDEAGEGHSAVMHAVDGPVGCDCCRLTPEDGLAYAEADFFALHIGAAGNAGFGEERDSRSTLPRAVAQSPIRKRTIMAAKMA